MPAPLPFTLEERVANLGERITRLEIELQELKTSGAGVRRRNKRKMKKRRPFSVKRETMDQPIQVWNMALEVAKQDAITLINDANEQLAAPDRMMFLDPREGQKGTYLHNRSMRYFKKWMEDWPQDCTSMLPETSEQRAEELQAYRQWSLVSAPPLLDVDAQADHVN